MIFSKYFDAWSKEYYKQGVNVGKSGDFYTAVSVGELFGFLCAKRFISLVDEKILSLPIDVVEIGANEGYLLGDFLRYLEDKRPDIYKQISINIIEPHDNLRALQKKNLKQDFKHFYLDEFVSDNAFFLANELFDAFACELYKNKQFAYIENDEIVFKNHNEKYEYLDEFGFNNCEFSPSIYEFLKTINKNCKSFYFLTFDYFNTYVKDDFSIRIFKNHELIDPFNANLKELFGKCDITWNVNYHEFEYYLKKLNLKHSFKKQSRALMEFGVDEFSDIKYANAIKYLFFGFSDNFHCLEFSKIN